MLLERRAANLPDLVHLSEPKGECAMRMCMQIKGRKHCFDVPELVDKDFFKPHPPGNYPEFGLALTILALVEHIQPLVQDTDFTKQLTELSNKYIQTVQEGLPKGVELVRTKVMEKAA